MRWMIASDIHGSAKYCEQMFTRYREEQADRLILLGDLLYHGPRNDLPEGYAPKEVIKLLNDHAGEIFCVRGNCEAEVDQMVLDFPVMAEYALLSIGRHLIYMTHGHHANELNPPLLKPGDYLLCGHTHVSKCTDHGDFIYLNPGSISLPKEDTLRSYMIFDEKSFIWKCLDDRKVYMRREIV